MKISLIGRLKVKNGVKRYEEKIGRLKPKRFLIFLELLVNIVTYWQVRNNHYCYKGKPRLKTGYELFMASLDIESNLDKVLEQDLESNFLSKCYFCWLFIKFLDVWNCGINFVMITAMIKKMKNDIWGIECSEPNNFF